MEAAGIGEVVDVTIGVYLDEAVILFQQLVAAVGAEDLSTVEARAHTLKSSSANIWARDLSAMFAGVEGAAREGANDAVADALGPLRTEFEGVVGYLRDTRAGS